MLAAASLSFIFIDREKKSVLVVIAVLFVAFAGGIVRMDGAGQTGDEGLASVIGKQVTITGTVFEEPDVRENGIRLSVRATELVVAGATTSVSAGVLVLAPPHSNVSYGDVVRATGTPQLPEAFDTGSGRTFNYPQYLAKNGILYMLSFAQVEHIEEGERNYLKVAALRMKQSLFARFTVSVAGTGIGARRRHYRGGTSAE